MTPLAGVAADSALAAGAGGAALVGFAFLGASQAFDFIYPLYEVNALTVRQTVTPPAALGGSTPACASWRGAPPRWGPWWGGVLGDLIGVRPTLFLAFAAMLLNTLWLTRSPLKTLR